MDWHIENYCYKCNGTGFYQEESGGAWDGRMHTYPCFCKIIKNEDL